VIIGRVLGNPYWEAGERGAGNRRVFAYPSWRNWGQRKWPKRGGGVQAPAVGDTPAAMMRHCQHITEAAIHALEGNAQALSAERSKAVSRMKHLREQVELKKPWLSGES
jgi:L-2-hydroxyglutarate oxidase LhgO